MNTPVSTRVEVPAGKGIVSMDLCFNKKHPLSRCHFRKDKTRLNSI